MTNSDEGGRGAPTPSSLETATMRAAFDERVRIETSALEQIEALWTKALTLIPRLPSILGGEITPEERAAQTELKELNDLFQELRLQCLFGGAVPSDPSTFADIADASIKNRFDELRTLQARGNLTTEETVERAEGMARRAAHINALTAQWTSLMDTHKEQIYRSV